MALPMNEVLSPEEYQTWINTRIDELRKVAYREAIL